MVVFMGGIPLSFFNIIVYNNIFLVGKFGRKLTQENRLKDSAGKVYKMNVQEIRYLFLIRSQSHHLDRARNRNRTLPSQVDFH